ncbi:phosphatase PAP2 family protein [Actinoplanes sp. NPDC051346]|uniref:phosphatase PAP2 family protein n=1 Tax=Actinoplanes sp. NPDC051346 TaxID=3155048 RepID=UPI0034361323
MRLGPRLTTAALLAIGLLVPFALLAVFVVGDWAPLREADAEVTGALHGWALAHPGWVDTTYWWTTIFAPFPLRFATLLLVIWLLRRHARRLALWVVTTMAVGGVLGAVLKLLVGRHRPDLLEPVARAAGFSFPSGHALNATLAAGVFVLVLLPVVRHRWILWAGAIVVAVLTGVSRVVLGVHYTSDVIAGWLLGVALLAATTMAFTRRGPESVMEQGLEPRLTDPHHAALTGGPWAGGGAEGRLS